MKCETIEWTFLWVVENTIGKVRTEEVREVTKTLRGGTWTTVPKYQRQYASIHDINPEIGSELEGVRGM
jgi:hypothetical protein